MRKILVFISFATLVMCLTFSCKHADSLSDALKNSLDSLFANSKDKPFNGIILIAKDGETIYQRKEGFSDFTTNVPFKIQDQFVVGSVSKQFTAAMVLREYDNGHLDLHTPIKKYLPCLTESWADTVTIHHLLTHTHGIISLQKPTIFAVGTQYDYSQIGYDLLAKIVEKTSGKSFAQLSDELFKECGMNNTFHPEMKSYKNLVKGYIENDKGELEYTDKSLDQYPAAGAFISSAEDLVLWNQQFFGKKLLKEQTFEQMTTKQDKAVRNHPIFGLTAYGYGITVDDNGDIIRWGQTGYAPGFASMNYYFPQEKISVMVLENVIYSPSDIKKTYYYHAKILDLVHNAMKQYKK